MVGPPVRDISILNTDCMLDILSRLDLIDLANVSHANRLLSAMAKECFAVKYKNKLSLFGADVNERLEFEAILLAFGIFCEEIEVKMNRQTFDSVTALKILANNCSGCSVTLENFHLNLTAAEADPNIENFFSELSKLTLSYCTLYKCSILFESVDTQRLTAINIRDTHMDVTTASAMVQLTKLRRIHFHNVHVGGSILQKTVAQLVQRNKYLKILKLLCRGDFEFPSIASGSLRTLEYGFSQDDTIDIQTKVLLVVAGLPMLNKLSLFNLTVSIVWDIRDLIDQLAVHQSLTCLNLSGTFAVDIAKMIVLSQLRELWLQNITNFAIFENSIDVFNEMAANGLRILKCSFREPAIENEQLVELFDGSQSMRTINEHWTEEWFDVLQLEADFIKNSQGEPKILIGCPRAFVWHKLA